MGLWASILISITGEIDIIVITLNGVNFGFEIGECTLIHFADV